MSQPQLRAKQYAPLSDDEHRAFRDEAAKHGISNGLLARVLLLHGLEHLDDPEITQLISEEKTSARTRIRDGARSAARARWGTGAEDEGEGR